MPGRPECQLGLAVVSDIHGNLTALDAVIADIERRGIETVLHGGDSRSWAVSQPK